MERDGRDKCPPGALQQQIPSSGRKEKDKYPLIEYLFIASYGKNAGKQKEKAACMVRTHPRWKASSPS